MQNKKNAPKQRPKAQKAAPPQTAPKRRRRRRRRAALPAASAKSAPKMFTTVRQDSTSATVRGVDLIYKLPTTLQIANTESAVICLVPANPAYWLGTRIAALAAAYQNYRPLSLKIHYVPQCAMTQQGNVIAGTLWNYAPPSDALQQVLKTSNGGILTQCYKPATSVIRMQSNLQYNLFRTAGSIDQESNPFVYIALQLACTDAQARPIVPGYFYVEYEYVLKNPCGTGVAFYNTGLVSLGAEVYYANTVAYLAAEEQFGLMTLGAGSRIDIEDANSASYVCKYAGTAITKPNKPVWVLGNQQVATQNFFVSQPVYQLPAPIYYRIAAPVPLDGVLAMLPDTAAGWVINDVIVTVVNQAATDIDITIPPGPTQFYLMAEFDAQPAGFGTLDYYTASTLQFSASTTGYRLQRLTGKPPERKFLAQRVEYSVVERDAIDTSSRASKKSS